MRITLIKYGFTFLLAGLLIDTTMLCHAQAGQNEAIGTFSGAAIGGIVGNQFGHGSGRVAATATGVVAGGFIGNRIGASYDHPWRAGSGAYYYPYETGYYYYPNSYVPNYVAPPAPPPTYVDDHSGDYCREYSQQTRIGDQVQESYGTACLQPDGSWRVVDPP